MAVTNDAVHSVLSKARPLQQSSLEAFAQAHPRYDILPSGSFGTYEVREVDVKSALTVCRMPGEPWSLNPYTGCSHACAYCYVPDVAHVERGRWGSYVLVKRNLPRVLARELKRKPRKDVFLSSATDPYQPAEATHQVTRRALELLARADWPLGVLTRNPLVRRDIPIFRRFSQIEIGMSVPTLDDEIRRLVEPGAPPIEGRLRTLRALADEGFPPFANLAPAYPPTGGITPRDVAEAFRDSGVRNVLALPWRYVASLKPFLARALSGTRYEPVVDQLEDRALFERYFRDLSVEFARVHVAFKSADLRPSAARPAFGTQAAGS